MAKMFEPQRGEKRRDKYARSTHVVVSKPRGLSENIDNTFLSHFVIIVGRYVCQYGMRDSTPKTIELTREAAKQRCQHTAVTPDFPIDTYRTCAKILAIIGIRRAFFFFPHSRPLWLSDGHRVGGPAAFFQTQVLPRSFHCSYMFPRGGGSLLGFAIICPLAFYYSCLSRVSATFINEDEEPAEQQ